MINNDLPVPEAVLFDLDGTLLDNSDIVVDTYYQGMIELGYQPVSREKIATLAGKSTVDTAKALGLKAEDLEKMDQWFWKYFTDYCKTTSDNIELIPHSTKVLKLLKQHEIKIAVVTSNSSENAHYLLKKSGYLDLFDTIIGRDDVSSPKPAAEPVEKALQNLEVAVSKSVYMIGDTASDIGAAKNAKVTSVAIPQEHTQSEVVKMEPDIISQDMKALYDLLVKVIGKS